jgi:hypothetical protein
MARQSKANRQVKVMLGTHSSQHKALYLVKAKQGKAPSQGKASHVDKARHLGKACQGTQGRLGTKLGKARQGSRQGKERHIGKARHLGKAIQGT